MSMRARRCRWCARVAETLWERRAARVESPRSSIAGVPGSLAVHPLRKDSDSYATHETIWRRNGFAACSDLQHPGGRRRDCALEFHRRPCRPKCTAAKVKPFNCSTGTACLQGISLKTRITASTARVPLWRGTFTTARTTAAARNVAGIATASSGRRTACTADRTPASASSARRMRGIPSASPAWSVSHPQPIGSAASVLR